MSHQLPRYSQEELNGLASVQDYAAALALGYELLAKTLAGLQTAHADYHENPHRQSRALNFQAALIHHEAAKAFIAEIKDQGLQSNLIEWMV